MPLYLNKNYRKRVSLGGLDSYGVKLRETDLHISSRGRFPGRAAGILEKTRNDIEEYIAENTDFSDSLLPVKTEKTMPGVIKKMSRASLKAGVGPMAAVAGVIAGEVGKGLLKFSSEVIVENGGDVYMNISREVKMAIFAGQSPLSMKVGIKLKPQNKGLSVCSSSGTVGHSISGGNADAAVCISKDPALADAAATALGNEVTGPEDIERALASCLKIEGITGCLIICADKMGAMGNIQVCRID